MVFGRTNIIQNLFLRRSPDRGSFSSKRGNKNFYKGRGSPSPGHWDKQGRYKLNPHRVRNMTFTAPDLTAFELKAYISLLAPKPPKFLNEAILMRKSPPPPSAPKKKKEKASSSSSSSPDPSSDSSSDQTKSASSSSSSSPPPPSPSVKIVSSLSSSRIRGRKARAVREHSSKAKSDPASAATLLKKKLAMRQGGKSPKKPIKTQKKRIEKPKKSMETAKKSMEKPKKQKKPMETPKKPMET